MTEPTERGASDETADTVEEQSAEAVDEKASEPDAAADEAVVVEDATSEDTAAEDSDDEGSSDEDAEDLSDDEMAELTAALMSGASLPTAPLPTPTLPAADIDVPATDTPAEKIDWAAEAAAVSHQPETIAATASTGSFPWLGLLAGVALLVALAVAGWWFFLRAYAIDEDAVEAGVMSVLTNDYNVAPVSDVHCPSRQRVVTGDEFVCSLKVEDRNTTVTVTFLDSDGSYEVGRPAS